MRLDASVGATDAHDNFAFGHRGRCDRSTFAARVANVVQETRVPILKDSIRLVRMVNQIDGQPDRPRPIRSMCTGAGPQTSGAMDPLTST